MASDDKQTVTLKEDGHVLMEPREDEQCDNKRPLHWDRQSHCMLQSHRMLQVGGEIQEDK